MQIVLQSRLEVVGGDRGDEVARRVDVGDLEGAARRRVRQLDSVLAAGDVEADGAAPGEEAAIDAQLRQVDGAVKVDRVDAARERRRAVDGEPKGRECGSQRRPGGHSVYECARRVGVRDREAAAGRVVRESDAVLAAGRVEVLTELQAERDVEVGGGVEGEAAAAAEADERVGDVRETAAADEIGQVEVERDRLLDADLEVEVEVDFTVVPGEDRWAA